MPSTPVERMVNRRAKLLRLAEDPAATPAEAEAARERIARIDAQLADLPIATAAADHDAERDDPEEAWSWGWMRVNVVRSHAWDHETWNFADEPAEPGDRRRRRMFV